MAFITADRIKETTTTTGTGTVTLAGAVTGFQAFSAVCANGDRVYYCIAGQTPGEWEVGLGTWNTGGTLSRNTIYASSNAGAAVNFSAGTKDVFCTAAASRILQLDQESAVNLPAVAANPSTPAADTLRLFARKVSGRMIPKWIGPAGVDNCVQPQLWANQFTVFFPSTGTTGTGSGTGLGPAWTSNGTVTHPTPSTTSPAISNQMKRTRYANVATTTNQQLGPRFNAASEQQYWRGNAAGLGGFFFFSRFIVELWAASTCRIFIGLAATTTGSVVISDVGGGVSDFCGLWHDTTDPNSGANSFNLGTRDNATLNKASIALSNAIAAGNSYDFYMFARPNDSTIYYRLDDNVNNVTYEGSTSTNLPRNTIFMQPQCQMSNGTANVTATTVAIGVNRIYVESDH